MIVKILVPLALVLILFLLMIYLFSRYYKGQRIKFEELIKSEIVVSIKNIRTVGREENGWKNNFPSVTGWERSTILVAKNFLIVLPKSNFPFLFKTELQPFVLADDNIGLRKKLNFERVYKPINTTIRNYNQNFEVVFKADAVFGMVKFYLTFEDLKKHELDELQIVNSWCI